MNNINSEEKLAKAAYNWLRVSPVATIVTLIIIVNIDIGYRLCSDVFKTCWDNYELQSYINSGIGVILSALWHLILLQYVNNKYSAFVRKHGQKAFIYAGIRTGIAFAGVSLDFLLGASGAFICLAIAILFVLWLTQTNTGLENIKKELENNPNISRENIHSQPSIYTEVLSNEISSNEVVGTLTEEAEEKESVSMENKPSQQEILDSILAGLRSLTDSERMQAIETLRGLNFSSVAIRARLEKLSLQDSNSIVRKEALKALSLPSNQAVQKVSSTLDRGIRFTILNEIKKWVGDGLLNEENAEVIQSRYDFDIISAPRFDTASPLNASQPKVTSAPTPATVSQPIAPLKPAEPEAPRPSLLQTLTGEAAIRIYLYLGAFFVISAATFVGAVIPELRLPILIIGTFIFGGLALAIKKRLPQPSFALFIVFSFLLPITANSLEESLQAMLNYESFVASIYWSVIFFILSVVWVGGTKLYESRFFSIAAFGALVLAFINIADVFDTEPEVYTLMASLASFIGLAGVWLLKKWKDANFALTLFITTQLAQG
ncbi:MAG: hypothetical protein JNM46_01560, partial [Anaerolineales bacterium]|nr:hypothetical protein [Anaerolineales bacterium]